MANEWRKNSHELTDGTLGISKYLQASPSIASENLGCWSQLWQRSTTTRVDQRRGTEFWSQLSRMARNPQESAQNPHGIRMESAWNPHGICWRFGRFGESPQEMFKILENFVKNL